jgi:hypothetical protein
MTNDKGYECERSDAVVKIWQQREVNKNGRKYIPAGIFDAEQASEVIDEV